MKSFTLRVVTLICKLTVNTDHDIRLDIRVLKLLSKPFETDVLVKNSARKFAMLACEPFSEQTKRVVNSRKQGMLC